MTCSMNVSILGVYKGLLAVGPFYDAPLTQLVPVLFDDISYIRSII